MFTDQENGASRGVFVNLNILVNYERIGMKLNHWSCPSVLIRQVIHSHST